MELVSQGITIDLPFGWEGRITKRLESAALPRASGTEPIGVLERTYSITHLGNFPLPNERGDFGSGAVDLMAADHLFVSFFEFGPESVGQPLFQREGMPKRLRASQFNPNGLQHAIAGQSGHQVFFTEQGRAFSLYVVLGNHGNAAALVPQANEVLAATRIGGRP